ncbi:MAG: hypothetical protein GJ680_18315 [Alteromonadaceae bacterium]|nr:hypothetical protein [Alteromonadaceae bacterium]
MNAKTKKSLYDVRDVKTQLSASAGWPAVLSHFGLPVTGHKQKDLQQGPCPLSGKGNTKFRFLQDYDTTGGAHHNDEGRFTNGIDLLMWFKGWDFAEAVREVGEFINAPTTDLKTFVGKSRAPAQPRQCYIEPQEAQKRQARIDKYLSESVPIAGTLGEKYLRHRGIKAELSYLGENLRFHPAMPYWCKATETWLRFPTMLGKYYDKNGEFLTLHRTFLNPCGTKKAELPLYDGKKQATKMILAPPRDMRGGYIKIDEPVHIKDGQHLLGLSEGIENALTVREGFCVPVWAGYSSSLLEIIELPPFVTLVPVFADLDENGAGVKSAKKLKAKYPQRDVVVVPPFSDKEETDWNDEYKEKGDAAFQGISLNPNVSSQRRVA